MSDVYTLYRIMRDGVGAHVGITADPIRREQEHKREFGPLAYMVREGWGYSRRDALAWEAEQRRLGRPTGP